VNVAFKTILVATDFSDASTLALEYGRVLGQRFGAGLRVLHVVETPPPLGSELHVPEVTSTTERAVGVAQRQLADSLAQLTDNDVIGQILRGKAAKKIVEYAVDHDVDIIVMGTHGRGGLAHLLMGSVAELVVRTAPCPVLTVHASDALNRAELEGVSLEATA
jgi:nucleotide-binding universal stress UspA family protein